MLGIPPDVLGVIQSASWGWADPRTLGTLAVALALLAAFVWRCRKVASPLLRLEIFGQRRFLVATISQLGTQHGLEADELAMANSAFQTTRRPAQTLGTAAAVAILGNRSADSLSSFRWVWLVTGAGYLFSSVVALWYPARPDVATPGGAVGQARAVRS